MSPAAPQGGRLAVVISLFTYQSTFIARELCELARRGTGLVIYSLRQPADDDYRWLRENIPGARLSYTPYLLSADILGAVVHFTRHQPGELLSIFLGVLRRCVLHPRVLLKTLAALPKSLAIARDVSLGDAERVHAHWATVAATAGWVVSRLTGLPFSFTAHAWDIYCDDALHPQKLAHADLAVVCNDYGRRILLERNGQQFGPKVRLLYHGLDLDHYRPGAAGQQGGRTILAVGRLTEQKGFHHLIEACRLLRDRSVEFRCCIVGGDGEVAQRIHSAVRDAALSDHVELVGFQRPEAIIPLYQRAAMLAAPTVVARRGETDGLPNVVLEAMACGLPVVGTNAAGIPEAVEEGRTGLLVPPDDPPALADALQRLLEDDELRRQLGATAREEALRRFNVRDNVAALHMLLLGERFPARTVGEP